MKDLRLASQATRKSSLTRVNIFDLVGPSWAWATSRANFLHLLAQMRRKVARVLIAVGASGSSSAVSYGAVISFMAPI